MSNVVTFMRGQVTSIERQEPKTPERKARIDAMAKDCRDRLMANLEGSVAILNARTPRERAEREEQFRLLKIQQGKELIANGLALIRDNESPEAAIAHLRGELAVIDPGTEF